MVGIRFDHDLKKLERDLGSISKKVLPVAIPQAINRTLNSTATKAVKLISTETGIKQKTVREKLQKFKAFRNRWTAKIDAREGRAHNLIASVTQSQRRPGFFNKRLKNGRYKSPGVKSRAWNKQRVYKHTFIVNTRRGPLVAAREGAARKPLKFIKGPSIRREFDKERTTQEMRDNVDTRLPIEVSSAVNNQLRRFNRR